MAEAEITSLMFRYDLILCCQSCYRLISVAGNKAVVATSDDELEGRYGHYQVSK